MKTKNCNLNKIRVQANNMKEIFKKNIIMKDNKEF